MQGVESALSKHLLLTRWLLGSIFGSSGTFGEIDTIVEALRIQNLLRVLGKLLAKKGLLLLLLGATHVACLAINAWGRATKEGPVVLVHFVLLRGFSPVEASHVSFEVRIFTHPSADPEFLLGPVRVDLLTVFQGFNLRHCSIIDL